MKCDPNLVEIVSFTDGSCSSEITQWTYNEINDGGDGCYDLSTGVGLGGSYTLGAAQTGASTGHASVVVWPGTDCEGPDGSLYAAGTGDGGYSSECIAFIGGQQMSYSAAFTETGDSVNCDVSGYFTADCSDIGVTLLANYDSCLNQDMMAMKVTCTAA